MFEFLLDQGANPLVTRHDSKYVKTGIYFNIFGNIVNVCDNTRYREGLLATIWSNYVTQVSRGFALPKTSSRGYLEDLTFDEIRRMTSLAIQRGCDPQAAGLIHQKATVLHSFCSAYLISPYRSTHFHETELYRFLNYIIAIGCGLEERDSMGRTPLLAACNQGEYNIVGILISKDADLSVVDNNGQGALHLVLTSLRNLSLGDYHFSKKVKRSL
jgi:hypothetical protein